MDNLYCQCISTCDSTSKHKDIVMEKLSMAETNRELSPTQAVIKAATAETKNNGSVPQPFSATRVRKLRSTP